MKKDHRQPTTYFINADKIRQKNRRDSSDIVESILSGDYTNARSKMIDSIYLRLEQNYDLQKSMVKGGKRMYNHIFC